MSNARTTPPKPRPGPAESFDASALLDELRSDARPFILDGEEFTLLAPQAWPDAALEAANAGDPIGAARHILGEADYDRFVDAGGSALFLQRLVEKLHGVPLGESAGSSPS